MVPSLSDVRVYDAFMDGDLLIFAVDLDNMSDAASGAALTLKDASSDINSMIKLCKYFMF